MWELRATISTPAIVEVLSVELQKEFTGAKVILQKTQFDRHCLLNSKTILQPLQDIDFFLASKYQTVLPSKEELIKLLK